MPALAPYFYVTRSCPKLVSPFSLHFKYIFCDFLLTFVYYFGIYKLHHITLYNDIIYFNQTGGLKIMKKEIIAQIDAAVQAVANKNVNHFYFVACGGSQAFMMPAQFMFDREIEIQIGRASCRERVFLRV